jgi:glycosyltransferase involved in cell wall biosynthesis
MGYVLIVNNRYPGPKRKHQATFIRSIETAIQEAGFPTELLVNRRNFTKGLAKWFDSLLFLFKVRNSRKWQGADLFYLNHFTQYFLFIPAAHRRKADRMVIHWHGSDLYPQTRFSRWISRKAWKRIPEEATHIVPSKDFGERLGSKLGVSSYYVSPSGGVDTEQFAPGSKKDDERLVLGFAARLTREKGAPFLMKVLKESERIARAAQKPVAIKYIAHGDEADRYLPGLRGSGLGIECEPFPKEEMPKFYEDVDLLLFPTRRESLGLTALEAMSCGIPVVGTNDFAVKDYLISGYTGEAFPLDDHEEGIEAVIRCVSNLDRYDPRALVVKHYSREKVVEFYRSLLEELRSDGVNIRTP